MKADSGLPSRNALDATKGVLIALIVLGHNQWIMRSAPFIRDLIYNWHVFAFFLISFLVPFNGDRPGFMIDRFVRYMIPFVMFFSITMLTFAATSNGDTEIWNLLKQWFLGVTIGSADLLDEASGARLYWYLPALTGLTLIRWSALKLGIPGACALLLLSVFGFLFAGEFSGTWLKYTPLGFSIAAFVILPGFVLGRWLNWSTTNAEQFRIAVCLAVSMAIMIGFSWLAVHRGTTLVLASLHVYSAFQPLSLVSHSLLAIFATATIILTWHLINPPRIFLQLGKHSLAIYLTHQLFFVPLRQVLSLFGLAQSLTTGIVLYLLTLAAAFGLAKLIDRSRFLHRFLTPNDLDELIKGSTASRR